MDALTTQNRGFTLLEVLAVVLIIGMCVGLASAIVRPNDQDALHVEADRLSELLQLAMEESYFSGKFITWTGDKSGYRFWQLSADNEWREMHENEWARARTLPDGMMITSMNIENNKNDGVMRIEFSPYNPPASFSISMTLRNAHFNVTASPIGKLQVVTNTGKTLTGAGSGLALQ